MDQAAASALNVTQAGQPEHSPSNTIASTKAGIAANTAAAKAFPDLAGQGYFGCSVARSVVMDASLLTTP
jgi:hypothetical protein